MNFEGETMINPNANVNSILPKINPNSGHPAGENVVKGDNKGAGFADTIKAVEEHLSNIDDHQQSASMSIKELLSGRNEDITSVVAAVAKADMSFKVLVGVRNKLIEAYKQTLNMPV